MIQSVANYIPTLEKYLLSDNKTEFINSLKHQSKEKSLLELLTFKVDKNIDIPALQRRLEQMGIQPEQFIGKKYLDFLENASSNQDIELFLKMLGDKVQISDFNHPKPIDFVDINQQQVSQNRTQNEAHFPETYEQIFEEKMKIINQNKSLDILTNYGMQKLGQNNLLKLDYKIKQNILFQRLDFLRTFPDKFVIKFVHKYLEQKRSKQNAHYSLPQNIYSSLTKSQLEMLLAMQHDISKDFNFLKYWYKQNYVQRLDKYAKNAVLTISEKEEKRKLLLEIIDGVKGFKTLTSKALQQQTFMELLILDLSLENPHKKLFIEFLENMYVPCGVLSEKYNSKVQVRNEQYQSLQQKQRACKIAYTQNIGNNNVWHTIHGYEMIGWNHDKLISQYLVGLFKLEEKPDDLANQLMSYLNQDYLKKICAKVKLVKGETVPNVNYILKPHEINQLKEKKKISILSKNKKIFKVDEDVVLTIRVKNVKSIKVKVYELNLEKSYLQKQLKIDQNMNLTFLQPTKQFNYQVQNTNPFKESMYDLPINQIEKKQAVYIVDLQGQGISSRAVIRKGGIVCLKRTTVAGLELKFYDQEGKRIQDLSLWINNKKQTVKNSHIIPFSKTAQNLNIVAVKQGYAELIDVSVPAETYSWDIGYIYSSESFIVGNKAKIAIHPRLKLQDETIGLKILTKSKITVQTVNNQDIKSYYTFDKIQWCSKSDYIIEFPIQSYTKSILINVTAEIPLYCGQKFKLQDTKLININLQESYSNFINAYLNKYKDIYYVFLLGQNGEPIPNTDVTVTANYLGINQPVSKLLRTNNQGSVKLGKLSLVGSIYINVQTQSATISRSWIISDKSQQVNYSKTLNYKKGQKISLPLPSGLTIHDLVILKKGVQGLINSNVTSSASIKDHRLVIQNLQAGVYEIQFIPLQSKLIIEVISGKQWQAANQVYCQQQQKVYEIIRSSNHLTALGQATTQDKGEKTLIKVKLNAPQNGISQSMRAHVMIQNYHSPTIQGEFDNTNFINQPKTIIQKFALKQNQYYNNKNLSQEGSYVENRQSQKKFIGNNLQKPRIFLKRIQIRDTCQQQEVLEKEGNFYPSMNAAGAKRAQQIYSAGMRKNQSLLTLATIDSHNNFLALPGLLLTNIKGEQIQFEIPKGYNNFRVYLLSNDGAIQKRYSINETPKQNNKDLRHIGNKDLDEKKGWTMSREVYHLREGQKLKINRDSIWSTVSLSNIASYAEINSTKLKQWLTSWNSYSDEKKQQVYQKQFCHEINVFIKQNDPQFFKNVVRPYISNKVIKTFVDYALLEDQKCLEYSKIQRLDKLNDFEKILLIQYLMSHDKKQRAKQIAKSMELKQKIVKIPFDQFKRQFDTVINSKKMEDRPVPIQDYQNQVQTAYVGGSVGTLFGGPAAYSVQPAMFAMQQQQQQMSYNTNIQVQNYDPFSNRGYVQQAQIPYSQVQYAVPPQSRVNNWALDARNMSYANQAVLPRQQMHVQMAQQSSYNPNMDRSNKGYRQPATVTTSIAQAKNKKSLFESNEDDDSVADQEQQLKIREKYKQGFKAVQKTKQYTETTYKGVKNELQTSSIIPSSSFWSVLANHLVDNNKQKFLTDSFMYLGSQRQFTLGMCFMKNGVNAEFDLSNQGESFVITAKNAFSIFVKEVRLTNYNKKFGVIINQRIFDPFNRYAFEEDGTSIEKQVDQFVVRKIYSCQTVITNTSGTNLQLQLLLDVPQGSLPLQSHQYTQIKSIILSPYSTSSFQRSFYFPSPGNFTMYPANACRGKQIISKNSVQTKIQVKLTSTTSKMESFNDIIRLGNEADVLQFLATKNIFDPNIFSPESILWMLKNKSIYEKIINVLKSRCYFNKQIWSYSLFHKQIQSIKSVLFSDGKVGQYTQVPILQYFPYFSSRTHKFLNESKSTIRNVQFKNTYHKFIVLSAFKQKQTSAQKITFLYYLLLQDRIQQASNLFNKLSEQEKNAHKLQSDYFECFLDMYQGYPSFVKARKISSLYVNYPVPAWKTLFRQVFDLLKDYDSVTYVEEETKVQYKTNIIKQSKQLRISIPPNTKIQIYIFSINLQLYFSQFPFSQFKDFSTVKPLKSISFPAGNSRQQKFTRPQQAKDIIVQIYEYKENKPAVKLDSFNWTNPDLKVKINQNKGNAQVFFKGKQYPGCYCKVYSSGKSGDKFYRDGYTDITGTFKYVLADFEDITKFKIVFVTEHGGVVLDTKPPSTAGTLV